MLTEYSSRLDEISIELQRQESQASLPELLDELATTIDELLLTLDDHRHAYDDGDSQFVTELISNAHKLKSSVRSRSFPHQQLAATTSDIIVNINWVLREDKRAA